MDKKVIWGALIVVIALSIGGYLFAQKNVIQPNNESVEVTTTPVFPVDEEFFIANEQKSLKDLLALNIPQQCTFSEGSNKGMAYVANGNMRSDFTTSVNGYNITGHMIVQNNTGYIWTDGETTGFKVILTETQTEKAQGDNTTTHLDVNQKGNFTCSAWVVSESMFTLPANITFTDLDDLRNGLPE